MKDKTVSKMKAVIEYLDSEGLTLVKSINIMTTFSTTVGVLQFSPSQMQNPRAKLHKMQPVNYPFTKHNNKEEPIDIWQSRDLTNIKKKLNENPPREGIRSHERTAIKKKPYMAPKEEQHASRRIVSWQPGKNNSVIFGNGNQANKPSQQALV